MDPGQRSDRAIHPATEENPTPTANTNPTKKTPNLERAKRTRINGIKHPQSRSRDSETSSRDKQLNDYSQPHKTKRSLQQPGQSPTRGRPPIHPLGRTRIQAIKKPSLAFHLCESDFHPTSVSPVEPWPISSPRLTWRLSVLAVKPHLNSPRPSPRLSVSAAPHFHR